MAVHGRGGYGASASFIGRVRGDGGLTELFLEHHPAMTTAALDALAATAMARWPLAAVTLVHRVGAMAPGEVIVLVLTSSAHREASLAATAFLIDRLKTDVPLWKRESFADGRVAWVDARDSDTARAAGWG
ncbi:MAG: molybdenum cofactor biosynthesis protein MoaE [Sphingopyxis sp.]|nr:molybdenum cofactor biosynthesis protein MoaE [Sphingopyxis sp.]